MKDNFIQVNIAGQTAIDLQPPTRLSISLQIIAIISLATANISAN